MGRPAAFTEEHEDEYLQHMSETGQHSSAAALCGVSYETVRAYRVEHREFDDACADARQEYVAKLHAAKQRRIDQGSDRILELELKRFDPEYRDKHEVNLNASGGGGVIIAPSMQTIEAFSEEVRLRNAKRVDPTLAYEAKKD